MSVERRANLCLQASTSLGADECINLVRKAVEQTRPGANYLGSGLRLEVTSTAGAATITMVSNDGPVCDFAALAEPDSGRTRLVVGPLAQYKVTKHRFLLVPIATEINGYGFYKRFLRAVQSALYAADPQATITVSVPSDEGSERARS